MAKNAYTTAIYGENGSWVRPCAMRENPIEINGKTVKRFEFVGSLDFKWYLWLPKSRSAPRGDCCGSRVAANLKRGTAPVAIKDFLPFHLACFCGKISLIGDMGEESGR